MGAGEDVVEGVGAAVVEEFDLLINAAERGSVEAFVAVTGRAEANVMNLAVCEIRAAVASGAGGVVAVENELAALGGSSE